jgi:hypothetical protein
MSPSFPPAERLIGAIGLSFPVAKGFIEAMRLSVPIARGSIETMRPSVPMIGAVIRVESIVPALIAIGTPMFVIRVSIKSVKIAIGIIGVIVVPVIGTRITSANAHAVISARTAATH